MKNAVFLDRDGVINYDFGYVCEINRFVLIDGVIEAVRIIKELGYLCVVVTNQAGIARGLYSDEDFKELNAYMLEIFSRNDVNIDGVYYCPHHPDFNGTCECRKPKPGMIIKAAQELNISLSGSYLLGDKVSDVQAGISAGIKKSYKIGESLPNVKTFCTLFDFSNWLMNKSYD